MKGMCMKESSRILGNDKGISHADIILYDDTRHRCCSSRA